MTRRSDPAAYRETPMPRTTPTTGSTGILAGHRPLNRWLHLSFVVLVIASAVRYLQGHGLGDHARFVLPGAVVLLLVYAVGHRAERRWAPVWLAALVGCWMALAWMAPSFAWAAVALVFMALRVLSFPVAVGVTVLLVVVVTAAWSRMTGLLDPTVVLGPICVALLAVSAYRALERDAVTRRALLAELEEAQDEVGQAERRAGVTAERARISREIHDSVAQGLTSINLLLQAAGQEWEGRPEVARGHVDRAAGTARSSLDEVRRMVRDLAPAELDGAALPDAVAVVAADVADTTGLAVSVHVHGDPAPVPPAVATAVLRTVRGALANVVEHASSPGAEVSLTFLTDSVSVDVRDDGVGFDPDRPTRRGDLRGHGLAGLRARAHELGGTVTVESAPGEGTVIAASFPHTTARRTP